jgi:site-specific DNA-adenine methylase
LITSTPDSDKLLIKRLDAQTDVDCDYWSFRGNSKREHGHGLFPYPAMMVPQMVRSIISQIKSVHPNIKSAADPFVGSGTILTESMMAGLAFSGNDVNPLAVLLCKVKRGPFFLSSLRERINTLLFKIAADDKLSVDLKFNGLDKWFRLDVQIQLARIRRGIKKEPNLWARRFFWVALAEVARLTSNSRTSTFKLHARKADETIARILDPIRLFTKILNRNANHFYEQARELAESGLLSKGRYIKNVEVILGDSKEVSSAQKSDIIITSPPYGDNTTTVPYGQYSFLPLQWLDFEDIDKSATSDFLRTTQEIDSRSLGGARTGKAEDMEVLFSRAPSLRRYCNMLKDEPADRVRRVTRFVFDLDLCLAPILDRLSNGGIMVWTLGNRKVGGRRLPLDEILSELLVDHGSELLCELHRKIPGKRMASRNNSTDTMTSESIVVMRKSY